MTTRNKSGENRVEMQEVQQQPTCTLQEHALYAGIENDTY
jgi:hypothetical protein